MDGLQDLANPRNVSPVNDLRVNHCNAYKTPSKLLQSGSVAALATHENGETARVNETRSARVELTKCLIDLDCSQHPRIKRGRDRRMTACVVNGKKE